jgi:hypothetical protein
VISMPFYSRQQFASSATWTKSIKRLPRRWTYCGCLDRHCYASRLYNSASRGGHCVFSTYCTSGSLLLFLRVKQLPHIARPGMSRLVAEERDQWRGRMLPPIGPEGGCGSWTARSHWSRRTCRECTGALSARPPRSPVSAAPRPRLHTRPRDGARQSVSLVAGHHDYPARGAITKLQKLG